MQAKPTKIAHHTLDQFGKYQCKNEMKKKKRKLKMNGNASNFFYYCCCCYCCSHLDLTRCIISGKLL